MNFEYIDYSPATKSLDIFVNGCKAPYCKDCCNPELINFDNGTYWMNFMDEIRDKLEKYDSLIDNIFLLGGSFNHQDNLSLKAFFLLMTTYSNKKFWLFAREELDDVKFIFKERCAFIKCGAYKPELHDNNNIQYGIKLSTSNQKIYKRGLDY